jgi:hypothetical protein
MNEKPRVHPSAWYYALAAPFLIAGLAIFVYALLHTLLHIGDSLTQVVVPGEAKLDLKHANLYTVFIERESVVNGKIYVTTDSLNGLECNLVPPSGVEKIPMRSPHMTTTYNIGQRSGRSLFEFRVPEDGSYSFACGYSGTERGGQEAVLAVGAGVGEGIFRSVLICLGGLFGGFATAGAVIATVFILRERSKKRLASPSPLSS